jgi:hypothetical protein
MIYCNGKNSGLHALHDLFNRYALNSCQIININKSTIISNAISHQRLNQIVDILHFKIGTLPFNYLGVPIIKGKPNGPTPPTNC